MTTSLTKGSMYITASQLIFLVSSYAAQFILGAYMGPALYGTYGVIVALATTVSLFLVSGLPESVSKYISENHERGEIIKKEALMVQAVLSVFVAIAYFFSAGAIADIFKDPSLKIYIQISAFFIPARAISAIYSGFFNGFYEFKKQATALSIFSLSRLFFTLILAYFFSLKGAVIGFISAPFFSWLYSSLTFKIKKGKVTKFGVMRLIKFAGPILIFSLALTLVMSLDLFLVKAILVNDEQTGYYNAAAVISKLPYMLFGAIAIVLFPAISNSVKNNQLDKSRRLINQSMRYLLILLLPSIILISATSRGLLSLVYTEKYIPAATALSILIIGLGFLTVFYLMSKILIASGKPVIPMVSLVGMVILDYILNIILIRGFGIAGAAAATAITTFLAMLLASIFVYKNFKTLVPWNSLVKNLLAGIIILFIAINIRLSKYMIPLEYVVLFLFYLGLLVIFREIKKEDIKRFSWLTKFVKNHPS